jgi:hypothetical protein
MKVLADRAVKRKVAEAPVDAGKETGSGSVVGVGTVGWVA